MCALEGHQLPTDHGGVAGVLGIVAPAAVGRVLGVEDEVHSPLRRHTHAPIAAQPVGLTKCDRGQTVRIHHLHTALGQVAVGLLILDQPVDAFGDMFLVLAFGNVRLSSGKEGQQAHCRCPVIGRNLACAGATLVGASVHVMLQAPMAVVKLVIGQPDQGGGHRTLGVYRAATVGQHLLSPTAAAAAETAAGTAAADILARAQPYADPRGAGQLGSGAEGHCPAAARAHVLHAAGRAAAPMLENLAVVVMFLLLGLLGRLFQCGIDIQLRRRGFFDFADIDLIELLGLLLLLFLLGLRLHNGRVAEIVVMAEIRQQQQDRKRQEMKTETAGVPDQFGPHPVHETFP